MAATVAPWLVLGVVSDAKYGYNNCVDTDVKLYLKNTIYILPENTCRNEPGKRLNKPVPGRQGRNEHRPIKGIDTTLSDMVRAEFSARSRNEYRPIKGIDTSFLEILNPSQLE